MVFAMGIVEREVAKGSIYDFAVGRDVEKEAYMILTMIFLSQ